MISKLIKKLLYAQFAHLADTFPVKWKCGYCGRSQGDPTIHILPYMACNALRGSKKIKKNQETYWNPSVCPVFPLSSNRSRCGDMWVLSAFLGRS